MAVDPNVRLNPRLQRIARLLTCSLLGGLAFLTGHVAESAPPIGDAGASSGALTEAWSLAESAQALAESHQLPAALSRYQRAYDLSRDPSLLLELGRIERELGSPARAAYALAQFLEQGSERVSEARRALVARQLREASASTARVNVQTNVVGASAELEPERGVATSAGFVVSAILDAGERRISLSKPGYETKTVVLDLQPGEVRALRVDLDKAAGGRSDTSSGKLRFGMLRAPRPLPRAAG